MVGEPSDVDADEAFQFVLSLHRLLRELHRAAPPDGLPRTQLLVLAKLARSGPLRIGTLAEEVGCSQPTATKVVHAMEDSGLVARAADTSDKRASYVHLTQQGRRRLAAVVRDESRVLIERFGDLEQDEVELLLKAGAVLRRLTESSAPEIDIRQSSGDPQ
ncbi:MarR family winged helix-turn-helix transcriptional regulator [Amycolatopsis sp. FDAARGOS 1241]|uniref:MarR family winged helix-turn-helix transcriptional regulator n=1 Tax=Amycolatopsis sp. FDAARGOS 1241 TaxID=2778070 RepID=UPI0019516B0C|nr:MarR family transcriptional regulator [Amycolatopsis sp. FDAARGOS 1241]QRP47635.1 MarR family transcriptional regulator [Amycolatopsis sp. FDAARGOS 1241]